jgi:hypothetical protein
MRYRIDDILEMRFQSGEVEGIAIPRQVALRRQHVNLTKLRNNLFLLYAVSRLFGLSSIGSSYA